MLDHINRIQEELLEGMKELGRERSK